MRVEGRGKTRKSGCGSTNLLANHLGARGEGTKAFRAHSRSQLPPGLAGLILWGTRGDSDSLLLLLCGLGRLFSLAGLLCSGGGCLLLLEVGLKVIVKALRS